MKPGYEQDRDQEKDQAYYFFYRHPKSNKQLLFPVPVIARVCELIIY